MQFLCNRSITVQYAFKKNSKGERHGSEAERMLAANNPNRFKPNMKFSSGKNLFLCVGNCACVGACACACACAVVADIDAYFFTQDQLPLFHRPARRRLT